MPILSSALGLLSGATKNLGSAITRSFIRRWWRFWNRCWACGGWPQLPGRHVCQACSLQALRLDTGTIMVIKREGRRA